MSYLSSQHNPEQEFLLHSHADTELEHQGFVVHSQVFFSRYPPSVFEFGSIRIAMDTLVA
jgi:hypothetical protein